MLTTLAAKKLQARQIRLTRFHAHQQAAQTEQYQARLAAQDAPEQSSRMVAMNLAQRLARGDVQQVHQAGIILLLEVMHGLPYEPVRIQFTTQGAKFTALFRTEQRVGHALCATKSGHDTPDGSNFNLG